MLRRQFFGAGSAEFFRYLSFPTIFFMKKGRAQRGFFFRYLPCPTILLMKKAARSAEILVHDAQNLGPCLEPLCCLFHPLKKFSKNCQEMLKTMLKNSPTLNPSAPCRGLVNALKKHDA